MDNTHPATSFPSTAEITNVPSLPMQMHSHGTYLTPNYHFQKGLVEISPLFATLTSLRCPQDAANAT